MKPLKLTIQGIRSFSEKVEVDFDSVSKNGLFGIFGSTGSGKSTILDSIIIALYGELSGMKMVELISARCKSAYVGLSFEISQNGIRRSYFVERAFKLKKDGGYGGAIASLYETTSGSTVVMASQTNDVNKKVEEIIGLGQSEFTKCIILPQGEFAQFVKAPKAERVRIIEKLFSLERYGDSFNIKLKNKLDEIDRQLLIKREDLSHYEDATEEALKEALFLQENLQKSLVQEDVKLNKITEYIEKNQYYYNLNKQFASDSKILENLTNIQAEIEGKKSKLAIYEKAEKIHTQNKKAIILKEEYNRKLTALNLATLSYDKALSDYKTFESEYEKIGDLDKQREEYLKKKEELINAKGDYALYKEIEQALKTLSAKIDTINKNLLLYSAKIDDLDAIIIKLKESLSEIEQKTSLNSIFSQVASVALKDEYQRQAKYYNEQAEKVKSFEDNGELYGYVSQELKSRLLEYTAKINELDKAENISPEKALEEYKNLLKIKKGIEEDLSSASVEKATAINKRDALLDEVKNLSLDKENQRNKLDTLSVKLLKITDNISDFETNCILYSDLVKNLEERREALIKNYFNAKNTLADMSLSLKTLNVEKDGALKLLNEQLDAVKCLLDEDVLSVEYADEICSGDVDFNTLKAELEKYDADYAFYFKSVSRMKGELEKACFSADEYEQKLKEKAECSQYLENLKENFIKCKNNTEKLSQNFDKRCIIEKDINIICARENVFKRLEQAVSRRAFSEFISAEFLLDVARTARKTLLELTGGKYDVTYKDSLEGGKDGFYIVDNLNGGAERSVSSLSGGETFLVSLSLALALSSSIYAGSDRPMEFFFLDEGFGTLDEDLVDTVLDSLAKLRNKSFSIGLISHLAEMKCRIDSKITVLPADETHGSRVIYT